jgi:predicted NACHT family NTPase
MTTLATKVEQFIKLRDHKTKAKKAFDQSMERINEAIDKLEGEILGGLQEQGLENARTKIGTAYILTQGSASIKDREAFESWCDATGNQGAMDIRANKAAIRELLADGEEVPGVKYTERVTIGVRRK